MYARTRIAVVVAVCGAVAAVAGCRADTGTAPEPAATPTTTPAASPSSDGGPGAGTRAALAAYRGMWDVFIQASNDGAASSPDLAKYADGRALMTLNDGLARNKAAGLITKGLPRMAPMVTEIAPIDAPTTVTVTDCIDDSTWLQYRRDNGQLANDKPGGRQSSRATVTVSGGVWKVSSFGIQAVGTC